ncbi:MAG: PKD domain-containing protein, partial [Candidatus Electrothrix sp. AX2]|nr:PKD domain-containing protein [Candidatus Electrothrix gigas]
SELLRLDGFSSPRRLDICRNDQSIWVSDAGHDQIVHLDKNGALLSRLDGFDNPIGVAVDQRDCSVWVADNYNNQVVQLDSDGSELFRGGNFNRPVGISVNSRNGNVWVANYYGAQVVKLTADGAEIIRLDTFSSPHDVKVSQQDGSVWVADRNNSAIVQLAPDGTEGIRNNDFSYPLSLALDEGTRLLTHPPTAQATVTPQSGKTPLTVSFDNSGSTDNSGLSRYEWDFDGDMVFDYASSTPGTTTHTYAVPGIYTPILRVTDNTGLVDYDSAHTIYATDLTVEADAAPTTGVAPLEVKFNARITGLAPGRTIRLYEWDVNNDGIIDHTSKSTPEYLYEYSGAGKFTAVLKVTDSENATAFGSVTVSVAPGTPSASASVSPSSGELPLGVSLSGSGNDPDGSIVLYEWDYDGDGIFDWFSDENADTYFTYSAAGSYSPTLRVTDNEGFTVMDTASVTVTERMVPPSVIAQADKKKGQAPLSVHFSGTAQDPDDNSITEYAWDVDGDGTWDYSSADSTAADHTYTVPGEYTAVLQATDSDGLTATDTVSIKVLSPGVPEAVIQTDVTYGKVPLTVQFDSSGSSDPDGTIVQYQWNFGSTQVWVADTDNNRVKTLVGSKITDSFTGIDNPNRILVDQDEATVWVTQDNESGVVKLAADGSQLTHADNFSDPRSIALDQSDHSVWITDSSHQQLVHLDKDGIELNRLNGFNEPYGVAVDQEDRSVWVSDFTDDQVIRLDTDGNETARFFGFDEPGWLTWDPADSSILIADRRNNRIVRLAHDTPDGYSISTKKITPDATGTAHSFLMNNAATDTGQLSDALLLNGTDGYLLLPSNPAHDVQNFTFEAWCKSTEVWNRSLFMRGNSAGGNEILILFSSNTQLKVIVDDQSYYFNGTVTFSDDTWHHIAVVYDADADTLTCYVDGIQYGEVAETGDVTLDFGNSNTLIGADYDSFNGSLGNYFLGSLDDVRIWSFARSAAEIVGNKDEELTGTEPGLVGYWPMNEIVDTPYHTVRDGFYTPTCIALDPFDQSVWVCDYNNSQLVKLTPSFDREITRVSGFDRPFAATVDPVDGTVWVADRYHSQLVQLAQDGTELQRLSGLNGPLSVSLLNATDNTVTRSDDTPVSRVFSADGEYPVTLTVTDNNGNSDRDRVMITVGGPESLPTAYPLSGQAPLEVRFAANGTCANCTLENFAYDFDGNGSVDWATTISDTNTHTYHEPGTYTVTQKVTGNDGLTD